jgi:hypothetical protein
MSRCLWDGAASWMEPAFDETSMAWFMEQVYVGHELRALAPTLKGDLAAVKRFKLRPVRDADDGGRTEFRREEFHELVLAGGIERRCRFIEHDNVGPMEEDSREGQPLLLATGQYLVPRRLFIETGNQVAEADKFQCPCDLTGILVLSGQRIGHSPSQCADWNVSTLRHQ